MIMAMIIVYTFSWIIVIYHNSLTGKTLSVALNFSFNQVSRRVFCLFSSVSCSLCLPYTRKTSHWGQNHWGLSGSNQVTNSGTMTWWNQSFSFRYRFSKKTGFQVFLVKIDCREIMKNIIDRININKEAFDW